MECYRYGGSCQSGMRSFLTREEKVKMLKEYHDDLTNEVKGVAERIKELQTRDEE